MKKSKPYPADAIFTYGDQEVYSGKHLLQIAVPMGGIGAGCICLNGQGGLQDFSIRHRPAVSAMPDGFNPVGAGFAILHLKDKKLTRLVEGPFPEERIYAQGIKNQGYRAGGFEGLPRFRECSFQGEYPFAYVHLADPDLSMDVKITGFNPFIPLDVKNSSIPCVILEYTLTNTDSSKVDYQFSYHLSHLAPGRGEWDRSRSLTSVIPQTGIFFWNEEPEDIAAFGSASLSVIGHEPAIQPNWLGGSWFDSISYLWKEISGGEFSTQAGVQSQAVLGRNGGSIMLAGSLKPGESITYPIVITWYFPNVPYAWKNQNIPACDPPSVNDPGAKRCWRPFYASQWKDARDVAAYIQRHYIDLRKKTQAFHDALFSSTLPDYVLEAVSANLAIIKSPTILLQENGKMWGWEGCFCDCGCCPGSCTHVWNYAQSIAHLFPQLERTLREQELLDSMNAFGHVSFRSALPAGPTTHDFYAASDGQLGGIMKVFREWQISGDRAWLEGLYPSVKRSMDFSIETWDPGHVGVLEEPHHNTYDIEFWGPDGMCSSFYLGALFAMETLAKEIGDPAGASFYHDLARKGVMYLDEHLFNGEYYAQKVKYSGLKDSSFTELLADLENDNSIEATLLRREGPKYQYGSGCISDGVIGVWMAEMCGLRHPMTELNVRKNLLSIFDYNFKENLWDHANTQRPGYAIGDEPGLLLCTWPRGGKPTLPFVYSDEVWTGIEYQVASHLIIDGHVDEGLTIVKALRSRYDGHKRNPWNEYECGSYYARAMASYALLQALSGFFYSRVTHALSLHPKLERENFRVFFSTSTGWGNIEILGLDVKIMVVEGELEINTINFVTHGTTYKGEPNIVVKAGSPQVIHFGELSL
jgi:uncharacterized protein (DUF608 family)